MVCFLSSDRLFVAKYRRPHFFPKSSPEAERNEREEEVRVGCHTEENGALALFAHWSPKKGDVKVLKHAKRRF